MSNKADFSVMHMTQLEYMQKLDVIKSKLEKPVVLVGLMGSGKSSLGRALAGQLSLRFYDADRVIEEKAGCTVSQVFSRDGEHKFRDVERRTMIELIDRGVSVIASGGGAVTNPETLAALKSKAVTVWLKVAPRQLAERLKGATDRPLIGGRDPEEVLTVLLQKRGPLYARSDITIENTGLSESAAQASLVDGLYNFLNPANG